MSLSQSVLPEFDREMSSTRKTLERLPDDKFGWKPHEKSMPLGRLGSHLAELCGWIKTTLETESLDFMPPGAPPYQPVTAPSRAAVLEMFDQNVADARAAISAASDEQWLVPWSLLAGGKTIFTMPRIAVLRGMVMNHVIHHRGQLTVYLRLNDIPVPALYGPSADES
ncbi:MAG TPA: DinB family protein [Bryobacteraceae bacterium]|nr:DinB family protein [Bryobacteraceae bacterium]